MKAKRSAMMMTKAALTDWNQLVACMGANQCDGDGFW